MKRNLLMLKRATELYLISMIIGSPTDKEKLPARLITAATVLFLIFAGSPLADININTAGAESNPYVSVGTITVTTNNAAATFTLTGPGTYSGSGTSWSEPNAPDGTYTITYDPIPGYDTPASETQTLLSGGTITFTGIYTASVGTIVVNTNNAAATFTLTGPSSYSGSGTSWTQSNAPIGTYTITYGTIPGYDTPAIDTQTLVSGGTITFTGTYTKTNYAVTIGPIADASVSEWNPSRTFGNDTIISVRSFMQGTTKNGRSLIMFDSSTLPSGSTVFSATLRIYAFNVSASTRNYSIKRLSGYWNETNVTWNNKPASEANPTSYANTPPSPGWMNWTVTQDIQGWVNGIPNYGWQISDLNESSQAEYATEFYSKEYGYTNLLPELDIQYTIV